MSKKNQKQRKRQSKILPLLISLGLMAAAVGLLIPVGQEIYNIVSLKNELKQAQTVLQEIEKENAALVEQKGKLNDPEYIKSYARGEYLLTKDGEQVFKLPGKK